MQKDQFGMYALYSKNKPKSDSLLASHGNTFFKVNSTACIMITPGVWVTDLFKQAQFSCLRGMFSTTSAFMAQLSAQVYVGGQGQRCGECFGREPSTQQHWSYGLAFPCRANRVPQSGKLWVSVPAWGHRALHGKLLPSTLCCISQFKQVQLGDKMDLASYLLKPIQRMSKYALLLKDLIKECSEAQEQELGYLRAAEEMVKFQLRHGNDLLAMDAIRDCDVRSSVLPSQGGQSHTSSPSLDLGSLDRMVSLPSNSQSDQGAVCQYSIVGLLRHRAGSP